MSIPFAINGDKNIPNETATGTETSSLNLGFLPITQEPLDDGGIAPERIDFNGMFYLSTDLRCFLQDGGVITFNSAVNTAIGGYPKNAILGYIDANGRFGFVRSLIEDNQNNFVSNPSLIDGTHWEYVNLKNFDLLTPQFTTLQNNINTLDAKVVKIAGTQTVTGDKTFSGTTNLSGTAKAKHQGGLSTPSGSGNIVTTVSTDSGQNGYVYFGNGLIVQWGENSTSSKTRTVTLPHKYTSATTYSVVAGDSGSDTSITNKKVTSQTTTNFTVRSSYNGSDTFAWLAIGY
jgi:hypothetical protein